MRRPAHRTQDAHMGAAAAKMRLQCGADLVIGWLWILLQQGLRPHHHPGDAEAALRRLLFHEGALDRRGRLNGSETLQRRHLLALDEKQRRIRIGIDLVIPTIDLQCHHGLPRWLASAEALFSSGAVWRNTVCVRLASSTVFST